MTCAEIQRVVELVDDELIAADEQIRADLAEMRDAVLNSGGAQAGADALNASWTDALG